MKKSTLAKRLDRVEAAIFGQATEGAGDDMGTPLHHNVAAILSELRAQNATGLPQEREPTPTPPPTQAQPARPTADPDTIAWACERLTIMARRPLSPMGTLGIGRDELLDIRDRLSGGADGGIAG